MGIFRKYYFFILFIYPVSSLASPLDNFLDFINNQNSTKNLECESDISSDKAICPEYFIKQAVISSARGALTAESPDELCLRTVPAQSMFNTSGDLESYIRTHSRFSSIKQAPVLSACLSEPQEVSVVGRGARKFKRTLPENKRRVVTAEYYGSLQRLHEGLDNNLRNIAGIDLLLGDEEVMPDISCGDLDELSEHCEKLKQCSSGSQARGSPAVSAGNASNPQPNEQLQQAAEYTLTALKTMEAIDQQVKALKGPRSKTLKANKDRIQALRQRKQDTENMYPWIAGSEFQSSYDPKDFSFRPGSSADLDRDNMEQQLNKMAGLIKEQLVHTRKSLKSRQSKFKKARNCLMYNETCDDVNMAKVLAQTPQLNNADIFNRQEVREKLKKAKERNNETNDLFKASEVDALFSSVDCLQEQRSAVTDVKKELALGTLDMAIVLGTMGLGSAVALNRLVLGMSRGLSRGEKISRVKKMQSLGIVGADTGVSAPYMKEAFSQCEDLMNQLEETAATEQEGGDICEDLSMKAKLTSDVKACILYASLASLPITLPTAGAGLAMISRFKDVSQMRSLAQEALGREITREQAYAVERAHLVGKGDMGKDGVNPAGISNYTEAHLREKARILKQAGFSKAQREELIKKNVVGAAAPAPPVRAEINTKSLSDWERRNLDMLSSIGSKLSDKVMIGKRELIKYLKSEQASGSVEVMWFPRSLGAVEGTGHLGVRVNDTIYHINPKGVHAMDFVDYSKQRFKNGHSFYGYAFEASPEEKLKIISSFGVEKKFNRYLQSCSQTVCESLNSAGIINMKKIISTDPIISKKIISNLERPGYKTVYSASSKITLELTSENVIFRSQVGGALTILTGGAVFGAAEASAVISNLITIEEEP